MGLAHGAWLVPRDSQTVRAAGIRLVVAERAKVRQQHVVGRGVLSVQVDYGLLVVLPAVSTAVRDVGFLNAIGNRQPLLRQVAGPVPILREPSVYLEQSILAEWFRHDPEESYGYGAVY